MPRNRRKLHIGRPVILSPSLVILIPQSREKNPFLSALR